MGDGPKRRIARRHGAFVNHSGWSATNDPEWQFRKTLEKKQRDAFDSLTKDQRHLIVEEWQLEGVGFKF